MNNFKANLPITENDIVFHVLLHIPDQLRYFGPVRTYWMFYFERFVGYLASNINSRVHPEANLIITSKIVINMVFKEYDQTHMLLDENLFVDSFSGPHIKKCKKIPIVDESDSKLSQSDNINNNGSGVNSIKKKDIETALYHGDQSYKALYDRYKPWYRNARQKKSFCEWLQMPSISRELSEEEKVWSNPIPEQACIYIDQNLIMMMSL
jgi:hypothetical protein